MSVSDVDLLELAVYFCTAEALTNVAKHANATKVTVDLSVRNNRLSFEVADDGDGFTTEHTNGSSTGIVGIADRLQAIGSQLTVESSPGRGTTVNGMTAAEHPATGRAAPATRPTSTG